MPVDDAVAFLAFVLLLAATALALFALVAARASPVPEPDEFYAVVQELNDEYDQEDDIPNPDWDTWR